MRHACEPRTALADQSSASSRSNFDLIIPVRALRKQLGLAPNDLAVLAALVSFLPRVGPPAPGQPHEPLTIVFASNAALSERANGLDERTLRRCIARLAAAGLIERRNSANGKRFPLRYSGVIRDAFGFDLQPLIRNRGTLLARAEALAQERERLRSLKAEALALRAAILSQPDLCRKDLACLQDMRNILRRTTLTVETVLRLICQMREFTVTARAGHGERTECADPTARTPNEETNCTAFYSADMTAKDGQNVRHTESNKTDSRNQDGKPRQQQNSHNRKTPTMHRDTRTMEWEDFQRVADFFPEPPQSTAALTGILQSLGRMLRIRPEDLNRGLNRVGAGRILLAFDCLLARATTVSRPDAYFERLLAT